MTTESDNLDDARHQRHLKLRSEGDKQMARLFWIVICTIVAARFCRRAFNWWQRRRGHTNGLKWASRNRRFDGLQKLRALLSALSSYHTKAFSSISFGKWLLVASYTVAVMALILSVDAPSFSAHYADDVTFRAAWITLAQVPFVYFIATKRGPLNIIAAISYERINWFHRWAGRILFASATTHMAIMMYSISVADIIRSPDKVMIIVRYGVGAYGALFWIALTSILPLRRWSHRLFYINHWISTVAFLGLILRHVPDYSRVPIYAAAGFVFMDRCTTLFLFCRRNITTKTVPKSGSRQRRGSTRRILTLGHDVKMSTPARSALISELVQAESMDSTVIRLYDVPLSWRPGQHVKLWIPALGALEMHPFTPASCSMRDLSARGQHKRGDVENEGLLAAPQTLPSNDMVFFIRPHSGFTRRLAQYHADWLSLPCPNSTERPPSLKAFVDGPYGDPPHWADYEKLLLISSSTGVSFCTAVVDYLAFLSLDDSSIIATKEIHFVWTSRHVDRQLDHSVISLLEQRRQVLQLAGIRLTIEVFVTCTEASSTGSNGQTYDLFAHLRDQSPKPLSRKRLLRIRNPDTIDQGSSEEETDTALSDAESVSSATTLVGEAEGRNLLSSESVDASEDVHAIEPNRKAATTSCAPIQVFDKTNGCLCRYLNHKKSNSAPKNSAQACRAFGSRPDIPAILDTFVPKTDRCKAIVAVCSNQRLAAEVATATALTNLEFAGGKRERGIQVFSESFG